MWGNIIRLLQKERSDSHLDEDGNREKWACQFTLYKGPGEMAESLTHHLPGYFGDWGSTEVEMKEVVTCASQLNHPSDAYKPARSSIHSFIFLSSIYIYEDL